MRRTVRYLTVSAALLGSSFAHAVDLPYFNAYPAAPVESDALPPALENSPLSSLAIVSSVDSHRGIPTFVWASQLAQKAPPAGLSSERAALEYLRQFAPLYRLSSEALGTAVVRRVHDTGRGGVIVTFGQEVDGIELFRNELKVLMRRNFELVAMGGNLHAAAAPGLAQTGPAFVIALEDALATAFHDLYGVTIPSVALRDRKEAKAGYRYFDLDTSVPGVKTTDLHFVDPARIKKVFFPMPDSLVPAYYLELYAGKFDETTSDTYAYVIAADDGRLLYRANLTHSDSYNYRVWADTTGNGRPLDGPIADFTPHPTGTPDGTYPPFIASNMISMEAFNTNPNNGSDPWLAVGATETQGNNVDAYTDHSGPDGYTAGDIRANTTASNTFDYTYDTASEPLANQTQMKASVTQLFYTNNWLHDYFYDSGFDEQARNAQQNNFGRGGLGGDYLRAEAQDGALAGSRNNANMSTPEDGISPRMQMFLWTNAAGALTVTPPGANLAAGTAGFGPTMFNYTGEIALVDDGTILPGPPPTTVTDGCEPIINNIAGKIALIDRGACTFQLKSANAEAAGATGVIIVNNVPFAAPPGMAGAAGVPAVNIPVLSIALQDGNAIKAALMNGPVSATMDRQVKTEHDGTIDNHIVAHEWGHYIHHRLVLCGSAQCGAQSEGWGDFMALHLMVRSMDNLDGTFGAAIYSTVGNYNPAYYGIRRLPFTSDMTKNPLTFRHIVDGEPLPPIPLGGGAPNNAEVHNAGEIWASMLFEGLVGLLKSPDHTFDEAQRLMADYVVGGMKLAPVETNFTEQRDGILAAAVANDPADAVILANGFARRGLGSCAVSPDRFSVNFMGTVESMSVAPEMAVVSVKVDDSIQSCDDDGYLDGDELGKLVITVKNSGFSPLTGTTVDVTSMLSGVVFPNGNQVTIADIPPMSIGTATLDIGLDNTLTQIENLDLSVDLANPAACIPTLNHPVSIRVNFDDAPTSSATETVESELPVWTKDNDTNPYEVWTREPDDAGTGFVWRAKAFIPSDPRLESPPLVVSATDNFVMTFAHRHDFEATIGMTNVYRDGGLIEISEDNGANWTDISSYVSAGYNGTLQGNIRNPLGNQPAYVYRNPSWPMQDTVTLDLGTAFAGKTILVRFHLGVDYGGEAFGWEIDNIGFQGITNTPFATVVPDAGVCHAPVAAAGTDQTSMGCATITLDASGSSDLDGDTLSYSWVQTAGPAVTLSDPTIANPTFTTPDVMMDTTLTFEVTVQDATTSSTDTVDVLVQPGGCSMGVGGAAGAGGTGGGTGGTGGGTGGTGGGTGGSGGGTGGTGGGTGGTGATGGSTSSSSSGIGGSSSTGGTSPTPEDEGGCNCSTAGSSTRTTSLAPLAAIALWALRRRRRNDRSV